MAITTLPTKAIGSLGPVKADIRAYLRPSSELPAVELEAIKDAIIANATEIGLTDGTTSGSLRAALGPSDVFRLTDDFFAIGAEWDQATSGTAKITQLDGQDADTQNAVGAVALEVAATTESATLSSSVDWINPNKDPVFEARILTPSTIANALPTIGFFDGTASLSHAYMTLSSGNWQLSCLSATGSSSDTDTAASGPSADTWYTIRVEFEGGTEARLYVDGVLTATVSTAAAVPTFGDRLRPGFNILWDASSGGRMVVDWVHVRGSR